MSTKAKAAQADRIGQARTLVVGPKETSTIKNLELPIEWKMAVQGRDREGQTKITQIYTIPDAENLSDQELVALQQYLSDCESQNFNPINKEGQTTFRAVKIPAKGSNTIKRAQTGFWYIDESVAIMAAQIRHANPTMTEEEIQDELANYIQPKDEVVKLDKLG
jgi:hypothetical protein